MIKEITSYENKIYKAVKKLITKSGRDKAGLFAAEGRRIVNDAIESQAVESIFVSESFGDFDYDGTVYKVSDKMFAGLCDTGATQGILALCRIPERDINEISGDMLVVCDGVSDPGNMGTIIRTAECTGAGGVILVNGCADPYSPKVVRSTMGSVFRLPIYKCEIKDLQAIKKYDIIATALEGSENLFEAQFGRQVALVIGSEAKGVSPQVLELASKRIRIPMEGGAESLNASAAAAVAMYEIYRRGAKNERNTLSALACEPAEGI